MGVGSAVPLINRADAVCVSRMIQVYWWEARAPPVRVGLIAS